MEANIAYPVDEVYPVSLVNLCGCLKRSRQRVWVDDTVNRTIRFDPLIVNLRAVNQGAREDHAGTYRRCRWNTAMPMDTVNKLIDCDTLLYRHEMIGI